MSEPLSDERWAEIVRDNTLEYHGSQNAVRDIAALLAECKRLGEVIIDHQIHFTTEADRLRAENSSLHMKLSQCSEEFDKLSTQYHEARARWQQNMDRARAISRRYREFVEVVADASLDEMRQLASSREWQDKARALLAKESDS